MFANWTTLWLQCSPQAKVKAAHDMGGHGLGGACGHIKALQLSPVPHHRNVSTEGLQGQHALHMLGTTLELIPRVEFTLFVDFDHALVLPHSQQHYSNLFLATVNTKVISVAKYTPVMMIMAMLCIWSKHSTIRAYRPFSVYKPLILCIFDRGMGSNQFQHRIHRCAGRRQSLVINSNAWAIAWSQ